MLIAQISDLHIADEGSFTRNFVDANEKLDAAVAYLNGLEQRPVAVVATGDLTDHGTPAQYEMLAEILARLELPLYLLPGNHDEREPFRERFSSEHSYMPAAGPINYTIEGEVRMIALDTMRLGHHDGELDSERLAWLDAELRRRPNDPTAIFLHHPPFTTGIWWMDCIGLTGARALETIVRAHPQVRGVFAGHLHRPITTLWGSTMVTTAPSTTHQTACNLHPDHAPTMAAEPPMLQLHWFTGESFTTHTTVFEAPAKRLDISTVVSDWPTARDRIRQGPPFEKGGAFG